MRKVLVTCTAMVAALLLCPMTHGELIGVEIAYPDILSNTTGNFSYNAGTNLFTFAAQPVTITFDGINLIPIGPGVYSAQFYVDESGNFAGGVAGPDLIIIGTFGGPPGPLVTGEVTDFGWKDVTGPLAVFDFTFDYIPNGGPLDPYYAMYSNKGGDVSICENTLFDEDWTKDQGGTKTKHDTGPGVPEASTLLLFGSGLSGVLFYVRKKGLIKL